MKRPSHFKIGVFFLASILVGVGALFWIGAAGLFENVKIYLTFYDTSVEGLAAGSSVEYLGLSIGQVKHIRLTGKQDQVRISMALDPGFKVDDSMAVQLKMKSITGNKYLAVVKAPEDVRKIMPESDSQLDHPVIPAIPGRLTQVEKRFEDLYRKIRTIDFAAFVSEWRKVAENTNTVFQDNRIEKTIKNLQAVSERLETVTSSLSEPGAARRWNRTFENMVKTAQSAREISRSLESQLEKVRPGALAEITRQTENTVSSADKAVGSADAHLEETMTLVRRNLQQLDKVLSEFQQLARSLRRQPGRILTQPEGEEPFKR